jgi:hypothetical protein
MTIAPQPQMTFDQMLKNTWSQRHDILSGKISCPICSLQKTPADCICQFYRELVCEQRRLVPEKYRDARLPLTPSHLSQLPMLEQEKLYAEIQANSDKGWAFFAPAGYSKTTCSYALYKAAIAQNLAQSWRLFPRGSVEAYDSMKSVGLVPRLYVWRKSVPDLLQEHFSRMNNPEAPLPTITVEKIEKAVHQGMRPRVFFEEIDKIKPSDYAINQLFRVFDALDRHKGQIVIDCNLSKDQFREIFGDPIARRIKENCILKEFGF